jgi:TetR/AcrR family fatty acid metabolism transcriptional regulator
VTPSLAARVALFKQDRILDAAVAVFAEKGFHAASMRDVAEEAGIVPGSIYNHFENKAALLIGIFDRVSSRAREVAAPAPADADLRGLLAATLAGPLVAMTGRDAELFRVILAEVLVNRDLAAQFSRRVLEPMLSAGEGVLGRRLRPGAREAWLRVSSAVVLGLLLRRLIDRDASPPLVDDLVDALLAGLGDAAP